MKKQGILFLVVFWFLVFAPVKVKADSGDMLFSCVVYEQEITAYKQSADEYYLFIPSGVDLSALEVFCAKEPAESDLVLVDKEQQKITANFINGEALSIGFADGSVATLHVMQSDLPSLMLDLPGITLDDVHADKKAKHPGNKLRVADAYHTENECTIDDVELKGRGNTSWTYYEKKGYQIKFNKKTELLGIPKAKKWVLIPNASDASMVKNALAFDLASKIGMPYTSEYRFADLWINGEYRGTYMVAEKIEIGENRVPLNSDGIIAELDMEFYQGETYLPDKYGRPFVLKEPDAGKEGNNFVSFIESIKKLEDALDTNASLTHLYSIADIESLAKYYLLNEYLANNESTVTSQFWYKNGSADVLHCGPVWDFDSCAETQSVADQSYFFNDAIMSRLLKREDFAQIAQKIYAQYLPVFKSAASDVDTLSNMISTSAKMNDIRWSSLLNTIDRKGNRVAASQRENAEQFREWLIKRNASFKLLSLNEISEKKIDQGYARMDSVAMYRMYNPNSGEHFYTASKAERDHLIAVGWNYEGIGWHAPSKSNSPVYRVYNPYAGDHHYTLSLTEKDYLVKLGWLDEGIGWYSDDNRKTPLYRQYNPNAVAGAHNFTTSLSENNYLVSVGWRAEGIGWYGI